MKGFGYTQSRVLSLRHAYFTEYSSNTSRFQGNSSQGGCATQNTHRQIAEHHIHCGVEDEFMRGAHRDAIFQSGTIEPASFDAELKT
jgi:hypothetical protein